MKHFRIRSAAPRSGPRILRNLRLRTKFVLAMVLIGVGMTAASLAVIRDRVKQHDMDGLREELVFATGSFRNLDLQQNQTARKIVDLIADLPTVKALMTTHDSPTIQDASTDIA